MVNVSSLQRYWNMRLPKTVMLTFHSIDTVQAGFGWTNGVTFWVFDTFEGLKAPNCTTSSWIWFPSYNICYYIVLSYKYIEWSVCDQYTFSILDRESGGMELLLQKFMANFVILNAVSKAAYNQAPTPSYTMWHNVWVYGLNWANIYQYRRNSAKWFRLQDPTTSCLLWAHYGMRFVACGEFHPKELANRKRERGRWVTGNLLYITIRY